jgi:cytochrome d ubiquinol oxidase subunit II
MLIVVILFIPVVLVYQVWAYAVFSKKLTEEDLALEEAY